MTSKEVLIVKNLKKHFVIKGNIKLKAVDDVSFNIYEGETYGLVGESGSGKSTVAYTVIGNYKPTEGQIIYKGVNIGKNRTFKVKGDMQIVFQDPGSSLNPRRKIQKSIELPLKLHKKIPTEKLSNNVDRLLEMVGLPSEYKFKYPSNIGNGEKQLVGIARALATDPKFILLDEPTSALDVSVQAKVIKTLMDLQKKLNLSYLFITHDLSLMKNVATRVGIMYLGKICEQADTIDFFNNPLHPYTKMLLSSIPVATEAEEKLKPKQIISKGEIPSPINVPIGCNFNTRCPKKMDVCFKIEPSMKEVYPNHFVACHLY